MKPAFFSHSARIQSVCLAATLLTASAVGLAQQRRGTGAAGAPTAAPAGRLNVVKTGIKVEPRSRVAIGDGIIVYGTGFNGVDYIQPGDTAGRGIPGGDEFSSAEFVVCGKKIVLAKNFNVSVYDTATKTMVDIPESEVRLSSMSSEMYNARAIAADGPYCIVSNDHSSVADQSVVKLIDTSGPKPKLVKLPVADTRLKVHQVAIDAATRQAMVIFEVDRQILVYDIDNPNAQPKYFKLGDYGPVSTPVKFKGGKLFYVGDYQGSNYFCALEIATGKVWYAKTKVWAYPFATNGSTYCVFLNREANDSSALEYRSSIGQYGGEPNPAVASGGFVSGKTNADGLVGFGSSAAMTSDGKLIFMAGQAEISDGEHLHVSRGGGAFTLVPDATEKPAFLRASDVVATDSLVAFKVGDRSETKLGYIRLQ
jgi:hypothetical protein